MKKNNKINGFTLLELLVVLIIVSLMLYITYPVIRRGFIYGGKNPSIVKTELLLKYLLGKKYSKFKNKKIFVKFDILNNSLIVDYKKNYRLKAFKKLKFHKITYRSLRIKKIESGGKIISKGSYYVEISSNYVSPPFIVFFSRNGAAKKLFVNTYTNEVKID